MSLHLFPFQFHPFSLLFPTHPIIIIKQNAPLEGLANLYLAKGHTTNKQIRILLIFPFSSLSPRGYMHLPRIFLLFSSLHFFPDFPAVNSSVQKYDDETIKGKQTPQLNWLDLKRPELNEWVT
jgi:hypothetical protein